jgi:ubiquinone biosynthesis protein
MGLVVAVKIQHADIERKLRVDLDILLGLAQWAEKIPELAVYRPQAVVAEFQRTVRRELDFRREARNMQEFARQLDADPTVRIPKVYPEFSGRRVLTMEFLEGIKLTETARLLDAGIDLNEVARRGANLYLRMIFANGYYHADPHPGNLVLMAHNVIGLLDYGMVGRIDERLQEDMAEMLLAVGSQDAEHLASVIVRVGLVPADLDRSALSVDLADFLAQYATQSLEDFDLSGALNELTEIIRRFRITLPAQLALLLKVLVTLEGTGQLLSPKFSLMEIMQPYHRKLLWQRLSPRRQGRRMRRLYWEFRHLIEVLPTGILDILEQIQSGKFDVHLDHRGLEPSVNRLVLGTLASALFLGSSMLLAASVGPLVYNISVPGMAGCALGLFLGWRVWRAISRSMDRRR